MMENGKLFHYGKRFVKSVKKGKNIFE